MIVRLKLPPVSLKFPLIKFYWQKIKNFFYGDFYFNQFLIGWNSSLIIRSGQSLNLTGIMYSVVCSTVAKIMNRKLLLTEWLKRVTLCHWPSYGGGKKKYWCLLSEFANRIASSSCLASSSAKSEGTGHTQALSLPALGFSSICVVTTSTKRQF